MSDERIRKGLTRRDAFRISAAGAGGVALAGGLLGNALESMAAPAVVGPGPSAPSTRQTAMA